MEAENIVVISVDRVGCRVLLEAVNQRIEKWPGGDPEEQQMLFEMQTFLRRSMLELVLAESEQDE